ncbi:MAG: OmpA family protein [Bacteriodetes bacterium]|nr:OmpA family protein [Bacteroidota bacterium]
MSSLTLLVLLLLSCTPIVNAQSHSVLRYGGFANWGYVYHNANFQQLPGVPNCCPRFESGKATSSAFGAVIDFPLTETIFLDTRLGYNSLGATLQKDESTTIINQGITQEGIFTHYLTSTLTGVTLQPMVGFEVFNDVMIYTGVSSTFLITKNYAQEERITKPIDAGTFVDFAGNNTYQRVRNVKSGTIPGAGTLLFALNAGIGIELPVSTDKNFILAPELQISYGLTPVAQDLEWNFATIRAGLTLTYGNVPPKVQVLKFDTLYKRDTVPSPYIHATEVSRLSFESKNSKRETPDTIYIRTIFTEHYQYNAPVTKEPEPVTLQCSIQVQGLEHNGTTVPMNTMLVEEFRSDKIYPLLPYIFFDANDSEIPDKYVTLSSQETGSFSEKNFISSTNIDVYYNILNIIGKRMNQHQNATLTITGYTSDDDGVEKGKIVLAQQRAEHVRDYLQKIWSIPTNRLKIQARALPEKHSNTTTIQGAEENRRVEIQASTPEILDILFINDTLRQVTQPSVLFNITTTSSRDVKSWELTAEQQGKILKEFSGAGTPPNSITWQMENEQSTVPRNNAAVKTILKVTDTNNLTSQCTATIPLQQITVADKTEQHKTDKRIDTYNLILFDFNSAELSPFNKKVTKLIQSKLQPQSVLSITGHTDLSGDEATNVTLSQQRASSVASAFNGYNVSAKGVGKSTELYNNQLPEGRMYSRTVIITVITESK